MIDEEAILNSGLLDTTTEQAYLGAILIEPELIHDAELKPEDFYSAAHQVIFKVMKKLANKEIQPDLIALNDELKKEGLLEEVGGFGYLASLSSLTPTALNFKTYEKILKDKARKRRLLESIMQSYDVLVKEQDLGKAYSILDRAFSLDDEKRTLMTMREAIMDFSRSLEKQENKVILPSGIDEIDRIIGGFERQSLNLIACRPSVGKSTTATQMIANQLLNSGEGFSILFFSLEMSIQSVMERMVSQITKIPHRKIRSRNLSNEDMEKIINTLNTLYDKKLIIDNTPNIRTADIRRIAKKVKKKYGLDYIYVDYIQRMPYPAKKTVVEAVTEISRDLKSIAVELDVPVVALSQLNRNSEAREEQRPQIFDLRDSGALEQDADVVILIWRPTDKNGIRQSNGEFIVAKNRNGAIGVVKFVFDDEILWFDTKSV